MIIKKWLTRHFLVIPCFAIAVFFVFFAFNTGKPYREESINARTAFEQGYSDHIIAAINTMDIVEIRSEVKQAVTYLETSENFQKLILDKSNFEIAKFYFKMQSVNSDLQDVQAYQSKSKSGKYKFIDDTQRMISEWGSTSSGDYAYIPTVPTGADGSQLISQKYDQTTHKIGNIAIISMIFLFISFLNFPLPIGIVRTKKFIKIKII